MRRDRDGRAAGRTIDTPYVTQHTAGPWESFSFSSRGTSVTPSFPFLPLVWSVINQSASESQYTVVLVRSRLAVGMCMWLHRYIQYRIYSSFLFTVLQKVRLMCRTVYSAVIYGVICDMTWMARAINGRSKFA